MARTTSPKSRNPKELKPSQLRWTCPSSAFSVKTSKSLEPLNTIVGQPRAINAIQLGAKIFSPGYNIFVSGLSGTGRLTTVRKILESVRSRKNFTYDYCYVYNFQNADEPRLLKFNRGMGSAFCSDMQETVSLMRTRIPQLFEEEGFQKTRRSLVQKYQQKEKKILLDFGAKIEPSGFVLSQSETDEGLIQYEILVKAGEEFFSVEDLDELVAKNAISKKKARELNNHYHQFADEFTDIARDRLRVVQEFQRELKEHDRLAATVIVKSSFDELRSAYADESEKVITYVDHVQEHILDNLNVFHPDDPMGISPQNAQEQPAADPFDVYKVNLILNNTETEGGPVIVETTPTFTNLFGTIEKKFDQRGFWRSDFSHIKAGALLKADGGYLIINALDMLGENGVWKALKRVLLHRKLEIQPVDSFFQISQMMLKPEPVDINVKIILIGDEDIYRMLYFEEEDFRKIFKINANFDYETELSDEMKENYARFTHKICEEEKLRHFDRSGLAALIEFAVAHAGRRGYITLRFSDVADVIREASYYARQIKSSLVKRSHVQKALEQRRWRDSLLDDKLHNAIIQDTLMIDTEGERIGQINGLSVYSTGMVSFGKPARITVNVGVGSGGIINIEREVELSGSAHDKGVLILAGILRERFARSQPISLSASIAFEQSYDEIDGDSASSTEVYALLSGLARIPIKQSIAVTGSVNQKGDIQPIGGVNEKIEGFFEICESRGLTGNHGVIIPHQNVENLMLSHKVIDAVKRKLFHIWPVTTIEEGMGILTGMPCGAITDQPPYDNNTVYGLVAGRLDEFRQAMKDYNDSDEEEQ